MTIRQWARKLKRDILAVWIAARDPRVSWRLKVLAGAVAAYAFSPIDLIPDFIPVLGYLDDLLIVPAGIWLVTRMVPAPLMQEFRLRATRKADRPISLVAAGIVVLLWLGVGFAVWTVIRPTT